MDSNSSTGAPVQAQLGLDNTLFSSSEKLRQLIRIASRPNVHPQAVLAVEQLGIGLLASPKRISDAIDALHGNASMHVESVKAWVGLRSGELHEIFRNSTHLLQFFLLFVACRPCYEESEIGDITFEMIAKAGVVARYPVASDQITQLLRVLAGHVEDMAPIGVMEEIARGVDSHDPEIHLYGRMEPEEVAHIFTEVFSRLHDDSVSELGLTGSCHGIWLAMVFSWLLPEEVCVTVNQETIRGHPGAKLSINIVANCYTPWSMDVWRSDGDKNPKQYVLETDRDNDFIYPRRLPIINAKSHFSQLYSASLEDKRARQKATVAMGDIAGALTSLLAEEGKLFLDKPCCHDLEQKCSIAHIKDVMSDASQAGYSNAVTKYGWADVRKDQINNLYQIIYNMLQKDHTEPRSVESVMKQIRHACLVFFGDTIKEEISGDSCDDYIDWILDPASYIALDVIVTSTAVSAGRGCTRYMNLDAASHLAETDTIIGGLLSKKGLDIKTFRRLSFTHLLPGITSFHDQDLVITQNGCVAGMAALWQCSTLQKDALQIRYATGHIEREAIVYGSIQEADQGADFATGNSNLEPVDLNFLSMVNSVRTKVGEAENRTVPEQLSSILGTLRGHRSHIPASHLGPKPILFPESEDLSFTTRVSTQGNVLMVKHYIQRPDDRPFRVHDVKSSTNQGKVERRRASWIDSALSLATASHAARDQDLIGRQGEILANRLIQEGVVMHWAVPFYRKTIDNSSRIILRTSNELIRFFAAGQAIQYDKDGCFSVIIGHGSLMSSISIAQQRKKPWVIVS